MLTRGYWKPDDNHPWKKMKFTKSDNRGRDRKDVVGIYRKESQRGMIGNLGSGGLRSKIIMDNRTLSEL